MEKVTSELSLKGEVECWQMRKIEKGHFMFRNQHSKQRCGGALVQGHTQGAERKFLPPQVDYELGRQTVSGNEAGGSPGNRSQRESRMLCMTEMFTAPQVLISSPHFPVFLHLEGTT